MALTAEQLDRVVAAVVRLYEDAEAVTFARLAKALEAGIDSPQWAEEKLLELSTILTRVRRDLTRLDPVVRTEVLAALTSAYTQGAGAAGVVAAVGANAAAPVLSQQALALAAEATLGITAIHPQILRAVDDVWRRVIVEASGVQFTGAVTRREAAGRALGRLAAKGLTAFVDGGGRRWQTRSYVETAMRTASHQASEVGLTDRLIQQGRDLVIVSDHKGECDDCRPFEGKVLSLTGRRHPGVDVYATLDQAKAAGYGHPNCRHRVTAYTPGVTQTPGKQGEPGDYAQRQEQRRLERQVREWKLRQSTALDEADRAKAKAKVTRWTERLRQHEATHSLKPQPFRTNPKAAR